MENKVYGSAASSSSKSSGTSLHQIIFTVRLEPKGGLLGITLAGSEDISKPITISGIVEGKIFNMVSRNVFRYSIQRNPLRKTFCSSVR